MAIRVLALLFRVVDIFVFRLDERWGEILLSKTLTLVLVLATVFMAGRDLRGIGLYGAGMGIAGIASVLGVLAVFGLALAAQILTLRLRGTEVTISFEAIDLKTSLRGGLEFALVLVVGNAINELAEEGLFRGLILPAFAAHLGVW